MRPEYVLTEKGRQLSRARITLMKLTFTASAAADTWAPTSSKYVRGPALTRSVAGHTGPRVTSTTWHARVLPQASDRNRAECSFPMVATLSSQTRR
jgi:hypothetical protein